MASAENLSAVNRLRTFCLKVQSELYGRTHHSSQPRGPGNSVAQKRITASLAGLNQIPFALGLMFVFAMPVFAQKKVLSPQVPASVASAAPVGILPKSSRLNLAIGLPLPDRSALTVFLDDLYNPLSQAYHKYVSPTEFAARFGPTPGDYQALIEFARANGFIVTAEHPNRLLLDVNASVQQIERAFHMNLRVYQHPVESRTFYAPDVQPSLDLFVPVSFVGGLDTFVSPRPAALSGSRSGQLPRPEPNVGSAPGGSYMGSDFRNAYALGVSLRGAGQTVALVEFDGFYQNDISAYENLAGLPQAPIQTVLLGGFDGIPSSSKGNLEVSLDIEMVLSMAPGIQNLLVYETGPNGLAEDVLSRIANDNLASQISSSWNWAAYDPNSAAIFLQFAAQGQTFFNATGDIDAFVGPITRIPSDDPYVIQVGGTALNMIGAGSAYSSEMVWNRGGGVGSSGGYSTTYTIPSWQQGVNMTTNLGSATMRNVPDVSMVADSIYVKFGNGSGGSFGGTSCAAPLWAGFTAIINQQAVANGLPTVGFINPAMYHIGANSNYLSCFRDVISGNNTSTVSPNRFFAVPGYDLCTGWGTPAGSNLINALAGPALSGAFVTSDSISLVLETCPNGALDPGETVVASFGLKNLGITDTTNLVATLLNLGGIISQSGSVTYGKLVVGGSAITGLFTFSATGNCGATNIATLQLHDGNRNLGNVSFPFRLGTSAGPSIFSQDFDAVVAPALPVGWTVSFTGAAPPWATSSTQSESPPNSAFAADPSSPSDNNLVSPPFAVPGTSAQLSFRHKFYTETQFDGGALEISIDGGPFTDIVAAGGSFATNGYSQTISDCCGSPLANRGAWSGDSSGFITTIVNLPSAAVGVTSRLRWRFCSDTSVGATGWYVDAISASEGLICCFANYPLIESITPSDGNVLVTWSSISNRTYRLQFTTNLSANDWYDVAGDILASSYTASKIDSSPATPRFYRVRVLP
jgi:hypothetical protein